MKTICRNCGSEDVIVKDNKIYCQCCGHVFEIAKQEPAVKVEESTYKVDKMFKQVVSIQALVDSTVKVGTAFFISSRYALTNAHVLFENDSRASSIVGRNYEGSKTYNFELVDFDMELDIAILESTNYSSFNFAIMSELVNNGQNVYAIGNSKGEGLCIVNGLVSDKNRLVSGIPYIMCSALVTNGNSGGPLFNEKGFVIGMISMSTPDEVAMNYALPSKTMNIYVSKVEQDRGIKIF